MAGSGQPDLLEYGDGTKAKVFVGVETSRVAHVELPKLTFDGRSNAEMEQELALAHAAFTGHRSYAGSAIHHYVAYHERFPFRDAPAPDASSGLKRSGLKRQR